MKRLFAMILALSLLVLCACGTAETPAPAEAAEPAAEETPLPQEAEPAPAETPAAEETPADAAEPSEADAAELNALLQEIRERARPGTAGSMLTAAQLACSLLDWSMTTDLDEAQIRAAVEDYLAPMDEVERAEYALQMASVSGAVSNLLSESGEGLLEDIGGAEGTLWPWTDAPMEKLTAIFDAVGPADMDF